MSRAPAFDSGGPANVALGVAAESVLSTRADKESVRSFVQYRALSYYAESLRQYLTVRAGDERAHALFASLAEEVARLGLEDVAATEPSMAAELFRRARLLVQAASTRSVVPAIEWFRPPDEAYARLLEQARGALEPEDAELIELHFARGLAVREVAHVLGVDEDAVHARLERALAAPRTILGPVPSSRSGTLAGALLEAFSLAPRPSGGRPARAEAAAIGTVIGDRYEIETHLGAGAFADVYRARDRGVPDHVVALKLHHSVAADEESRLVALRELQLLASVFHPSVVQLKDHGWHEGRLWFVMPFYRGETLARRLSRGPLSRVEARRIFQPLAHALAAMHRAGVRHQDVKPENVFLARLDEEEGEDRLLPILLDLGVAAKDAEVVLAGTPEYFAPEVAARFSAMTDPPPVTGKADVFSLALALRTALHPASREAVLGGVVDDFVRHRALTAPRPPPSRDLAYLAPSFARWLGLSPDERPSAEELARELAVLTAPEERRARRHDILRWALPTAVAIAALFGSVTYTLDREARFQRIEAERARQQAEYQRSRAEHAQESAEIIRADLYAEAARRRQLETHIGELEEQFQSSRLTREELATRLARAQGELGALGESHDLQDEQLGDLRRVHAELGLAHERMRADLEEVRTERDREHDRVAQHESTASGLRHQLAATERELEGARAELEVVEARVRALARHMTFVPPMPYEAGEAGEAQASAE